VWDAAVDFNQQFKSTMVVRVIANDGTPPGPPRAGMALIPAGPFVMGKVGAERTRTVTVSAFYMEKFKVTKDLWKRVKTYAEANGYVFSGNTVTAFSGAHPVVVNWFDAVKWCNARSQQEGLTPVYYTDASFTTVYKTGQPATPPPEYIDPLHAKWSANGYRLPTEAEWEKAARGTLVDMDYPWGNTFNPGDANVADTSPFAVFGSGTTTPVGYYDGDQSPAGPDRANGYGLYDVTGNVFEWCWDWAFAQGFPVETVDPRGWEGGDRKIVRGSAAYSPYGPLYDNSKVWFRQFFRTPQTVFAGFRCARGL